MKASVWIQNEQTSQNLDSYLKQITTQLQVKKTSLCIQVWVQLLEKRNFERSCIRKFRLQIMRKTPKHECDNLKRLTVLKQTMSCAVLLLRRNWIKRNQLARVIKKEWLNINNKEELAKRVAEKAQKEKLEGKVDQKDLKL